MDTNEFDIIYPENKADAFDAECGKAQKTMRARAKPTKTWISKSKFEIENEEELLACRRIILKIVRYKQDNDMSQKELAEKLNVSPQYINKLLHGQDLDLKITTVLRYGRLLGIKLIALPEDEPATPQHS